jgi:hypothetical protein
LNFTAISGSANTENDEFIAYVTTKWDLNDSLTVPTFSGQQAQSYWQRPIRQVGIGDLVKFTVLNGNYIALLSNDESNAVLKFSNLGINSFLSFSLNGWSFIIG